MVCLATTSDGSRFAKSRYPRFTEQTTEGMETIKTTAIVKEGRITVDVSARDGTNYNVVLIPSRTAEEVEAILERARRLRAEIPASAPDPQTLKQWIEEGRL